MFRFRLDDRKQRRVEVFHELVEHENPHPNDYFMLGFWYQGQDGESSKKTACDYFNLVILSHLAHPQI